MQCKYTWMRLCNWGKNIACAPSYDSTIITGCRRELHTCVCVYVVRVNSIWMHAAWLSERALIIANSTYACAGIAWHCICVHASVGSLRVFVEFALDWMSIWYNFQSHLRNAPICNGTHFRTRFDSIPSGVRVRPINFHNPIQNKFFSETTEHTREKKIIIYLYIYTHREI